MADERQDRRGPSSWLPYVAVAISLVSMAFGPCFGAAVAVVGNYVTNQQDKAVAAEQRRQDVEKLGTIGGKVDELVKQGQARIQSDTEIKLGLQQVITDEKRDRHDIDENAKIMNAYGNLIQGKKGK